MRLLAAFIGRLGCRGTGLIGWLNEVLGAVGHEFGPPAVQCGSLAPPDMPEKDGLECPGVDVGEQGVLIGELGGDQVEDIAECARPSPVRACDEARNIPRVVGVELGPDWSDRARLRAGLCLEGLSRNAPFPRASGRKHRVL